MAIRTNIPVPTLKSWAPAGTIKPGDYLYGPDGLPKQVTLVQEYTPQQMYKVTLHDGSVIKGDKHLAFEVENERYRHQLYLCKNIQRFRQKLKRFTIPELLELGLRCERNRLEYSIPATKPIQYKHEDFPVPPFIAGYWYGSQVRTNKLNCKPDTLEIVKNKVAEFGYKCKIKLKLSLIPEPNILKQLQYYYTTIPKELPIEYYFGSIEQRMELLRGLLMSRFNAYDPKKDRYDFRTRNFQAAHLFRGLCESLGIVTTQIQSPEYHLAREIYFRTGMDLMYKTKKRIGRVAYTRRFITAIEEVEPMPCVHIETDGGTFLAAEGFIAIC